MTASTLATPSVALGGSSPVTRALRRAFLVIFILSTLAAGAELLLTGHTEDYWQLAPIALIAMAFGILIAHAVARRPATLRLFQLAMVLFIAAGGVGTWLHYQSKAEFKRELNPDLVGAKLFWESIQGSSVPPVIAPAMMIQLALLGLAWTFRHPVFFIDRQSQPLTENGAPS